MMNFYTLFSFNRVISLFGVILFFIGGLKAQTITVDEIRSSDNYLFGEGRSTTVARADEQALSQLISQIVVNIKTESISTDSEKVASDTSVIQSEFTSVITSYSNATLTNTKRILIQNEPDAHVFRYILKSEIDRIFESRKQKVIDMANLAEKGLKDGKIDNALKYYYWSFSLLKSLRNPNDVFFYDADDKQHRLITWLPAQMNNVFNKINIYKTKELDNGVVEVMVRHNDKAVASFDYTYFDGSDWSNIYSSRDGIGILELRPGVSLHNLQVKCEYLFEAESRMDPEIESVMKLMEPVVFRDSYISVKPTPAPVVSAITSLASSTSSLSTDSVGNGDRNIGTTLNVDAAEASTLEKIMIEKSESIEIYNIPTPDSLSMVTIVDATPYTDIVEKIANAIKTKQYSSVESHFTTEGYAMFDRLIQRGNAVVLGTPTYNCIGINNSVICRSITLSFAFSNNKRKFVENVSFAFNEDSKIDDICFCLDHQAMESIVSMKLWTESSRYLIVSFLENYKTAYALKRWDYLNSIFDDDALIITGRVVRPVSQSDSRNINIKSTYTILTQQNKVEYMRGLKQVFASNEFINLKFASNDIVKFGSGGELYGIQIKQDYFSTHYADTGYLFLMVDLNDPEKPIIHVRTWQQERDPDFGIIGPQHF